MLYDVLVAEARRNDSLDDARSAALDRVRWLADLLERQRTEARWDAVTRQGPEGYERFQAVCAATRAEIEGRLAACADEEGRAAVLCLILAARFDDTGFSQHRSRIGALISRVRGWTPDEVAVLLLGVIEYDMGFWFAESLGMVLDATEHLGPDSRQDPAVAGAPVRGGSRRAGLPDS